MNTKSYKLDNAAKIYPAAMTKKWNAVFRVSVYLSQPVFQQQLKQAVKDLAKRFPTFYVQLHKGGLWDTLVPVTDFDIVQKDEGVLCRPMQVGEGNKPMFRVLYIQNKISVEFFHSVTDGTGALVYIKTLTAHYLELLGHKIEKTEGVLDVHEAPALCETEDAFQGVYKKAKRVSRSEANAYQYHPEKEENYLHATSGILPMDQLKAVAKNKYGCTVTEYLAGVYAYAFLEQYRIEYAGKPMRKPVKISIPINLRPYFNSSTLRNFASFVNVSVSPEEGKTLQGTILCVKREMKDLIQIEKIQKTVSQNVAEEKMLISKISPNFLKKMVMKACFLQYGERKFTSPFSNIGLVKVPNSLKPYIERFEFVIGETKKNRVYCTAVGYGGFITVTLSTVSRQRKIEDSFFLTLRRDGVVFKTESVDAPALMTEIA